MMEAAGKGEVVRLKGEDQGEKCPKFEGNKDEYQEWRGKVEDWCGCVNYRRINLLSVKRKIKADILIDSMQSD